MKRVLFVASIVLFSFMLFAHFGLAQESAPRNKVVFYQDDGCDTGKHLELGVGEYSDLREYKTGGYGGQSWNDQITCIAVGSGITKVVVYEHIDFGGKSKEFTRSWGNPRGSWSVAGDEWNDRISSVKIVGPGSSSPWNKAVPRDKVVIYQDECGEGNHIELKKGEYPDLRELKLSGSGGSTWDDRISCIAIGSGITKVIVYEHLNFQGKSREFTGSGTSDGGWSLTGGSWNDKITSIKVIGPGSSSPWSEPAPRDKAVLYQDECGDGNHIELKKGEYPDLRELKLSGSGSSTWDDRISCIKIGSGITKVIVYEHLNFQGKSREFTGSGTSDGGWSLTGGSWNDKITSIKVIGPGSSTPWSEPAPRDRAVLYQDECGDGNHIELKKGEYPDLRELKVGSGSSTWDDRISCIKIGSGITRVIVYEHTDFQGRSKEFTRSWGSSDGSWSLTGEWSNDKITSIKIQ